MRFNEIHYLRWAKRWLDLEPATYNLASSGMQAATAADIGLDPPVALPITGLNAFGHPRLCQLLAERYGVGPERIYPAAGTSLANFLAQAALLPDGGEALCEWPVYEPLIRTLEALGARVTRIPRPRAAGFQPDLDAIRRGFERRTDEPTDLSRIEQLAGSVGVHGVGVEALGGGAA